MPKGHSTQTRKSKDTPAKVHGAREPFDIMAPKAVALRQQGYSISQIAVALGRGERQISKYFAWYSINGKKLVQVIPQPLSKEELSAEARKFSMYSAVGFFAFFHRFSGRKLSKAQKQWVRDALSHDRVLINLPSRHGKSTIFSVWFVIWLICLDRDVQIILISQTDTLAKKFSNEIAHHLEDNMDLVSTFGRFRPDPKVGRGARTPES